MVLFSITLTLWRCDDEFAVLDVCVTLNLCINYMFCIYCILIFYSTFS